MDGELPETELLIQTPIIYVLISTKIILKYTSTEEDQKLGCAPVLLVLSDNNNDQKIKTKVYKCPSRSASVQKLHFLNFQETVPVLKFSKKTIYREYIVVVYIMRTKKSNIGQVHGKLRGQRSSSTF